MQRSSNQIADILNLAHSVEKQGGEAVLATVVHTEGSAYRRAGAMMLISDDGRSAGMISGGCLEPHIIKRAFWLTRHGAVVQVYQTGDEEFGDSNKDTDSGSDSINDDFVANINFGLGCNGRVHVLFERLTNEESNSARIFLKTIRQVRQTRKPQLVATLIRHNHPNRDIAKPLLVGSRLKLSTDSNGNSLLATDMSHRVDDNTLMQNSMVKEVLNTIEDNPSIFAKSKKANKDSAFVTVSHLDDISNSNSNNGSVDDIVDVMVEHRPTNIKSLRSEWLIQRLQPQHHLLICGAGNDVIPLVSLAKMQDWHVTVIDSRSQYATRSRFMEADVVQCVPLDDEETLLQLSHNAAVAVMSHSLTQDRARLKVLLANPPAYLGQLGPKYRTERLISEILEDNSICATDYEAGIERLHYPIGFKLGGDGPEALALGIMSQISAAMHNKTIDAYKPKIANSSTSFSGSKTTNTISA